MTNDWIRSFCIVFVVGVVLAGCSKKEDTSEPPTESVTTGSHEKNLVGQSEAVQAETQSTTFDEVLEIWGSGNKAESAERFVSIKWDSSGVFSADSIFRISEAEFAKLSENQRSQIQQKALNISKDIKGLSKYIVEQAKQEGGYASTRDALIACGERLSGEDQLLIIQMVGKAIVGYTEKELPVW